ncbi:hypothetical protein K438DRAFT_1957137 [Mycena galopus ATCC 62051]|nr:hypothetical protein K438DRAFT_1957137 [Mycena galopus ATCC 62051]
MPRTELHELLARELNEAIVLDVPNFIGRVFPDNSLPLRVDAEALTGVPTRCINNAPRANQTMGETIREVCRISGGPLPKKKRRWCSTYAAPDSLPLSGHMHPALVLFDGKPEEGWNSALSAAEVVFQMTHNDGRCAMVKYNFHIYTFLPTDFEAETLDKLIAELEHETFVPYVTSVGGSGLEQVTPPKTPGLAPHVDAGDSLLRLAFEKQTSLELSQWADGLGRWLYV